MTKTAKRPAHEVIVAKLLAQVRCYPRLVAGGEDAAMVRGKIDTLIELLCEMVVPKSAAAGVARDLRSFSDRGDLRDDIVHNLRVAADILTEE